MKIVAFLQNPGLPPETSRDMVEKYRDDQDFHQLVLRESMTGKRLEQAFKGLFAQIHWDNADWRHVSMGPDLNHIKKVIQDQDPDLVLTFGNMARDAIQRVYRQPLKWMSCHHPNARHQTQSNLDAFAQEVRDYIKYAIFHLGDEEV